MHFLFLPVVVCSLLAEKRSEINQSDDEISVSMFNKTSLRWMVRLFCAGLIALDPSYFLSYVFPVVVGTLILTWTMHNYSPFAQDSPYAAQLKRMQNVVTSAICGTAVVYSLLVDPESELYTMGKGATYVV